MGNKTRPERVLNDHTITSIPGRLPQAGPD
jgi:hypothetical protein